MGKSTNTPAPPDVAKSYSEGLQVYLKFLPQMLQAELANRQQYDPLYIQQQQAMQKLYGPIQIQQQLDALKQMDPQGFALRQGLEAQIQKQQAQGFVDPRQAAAYQQLSQLAGTVDPRQAALYGGLTGTAQSQLARGTQLDPAALNQLQQGIRARQAATGNISGNAPGMAEAVYTGQRGQQLLQQRQAGAAQAYALPSPLQQQQQSLMSFYGQQSPQAQVNAQTGTFLSQPSQAALANQIGGIQIPTSNQFVNPFAGYQGQQFALQNYQNQLGASQTQGNPWASALGGAATGAALGTQISPGYGTAIGAAAGGLYGYFSDSRLKTNLSRTGLKTKDGIPIVTFSYNWAPHTRMRGVLAEDVEKVRPDAVEADKLTGFKMVRYDKLGIRLEEA